MASSRLAKRVAQKTGCPILQRDNENAKWWPVLFLGRHADGAVEGSYIWKLRAELSEALDRYDLRAIPLYENTGTEDEYRRAAEMLMGAAKEKAIDTKALAYDAEQQRLAFIERFNPEKLIRIPEDRLLSAMYLTQPTTKDYMMYYLEAQTDNWGSIWGGSSYKFGLFQREKDHIWVNASGQVLSEEQAGLTHLKKIYKERG